MKVVQLDKQDYGVAGIIERLANNKPKELIALVGNENGLTLMVSGNLSDTDIIAYLETMKVELIVDRGHVE